MRYVITLLIPIIILSGCSPKLTPEKKLLLTSELVEMVEVDQVAASRWEEKWAAYKDSVFTANKLRAEKLFNDYGFPGFNEVGQDGSNNFWLIVQHSDKFPEFQKQVLKEMDKQVKMNNADPNNYAYLFDRVQVNAGQKQMFGTQVDYATQTTGKAFPKIGLLDSANIDKIRNEYGLNSLKDYLNQMTTMHYEMNKERYINMGILEPDLY